MSCNNSCNNCSCNNTENSVLGLYKLKEAMRFRVTNSSFELSEGSLVKVTQVDSNFHKILIEFEETVSEWFHDDILDRLIKVNENSYEDSEDIPEYREFILGKEYAVGEFFKIDKEVFKVVSAVGGPCENCDIDPDNRNLWYFCDNSCCQHYERGDNKFVEFILYDTLED